MARIIDAYTQYFDDEGNPLIRGQLFFYETGTNTLKDTFEDFSETQVNTNPVILDGEGRIGNVFGTGSYRIELKDKYGVLVQPNTQFDPVGGTDSLVPFTDWSSSINYQTGAIVTGSDGEYYRSEVDNNLNNDPVSDTGANWEQIRFLGVWKTGTTYTIGDVVQTSDGYLWRGITNPNQGHDPATDDGTNWVPAIDDTKFSKTNNLSGGGTLSIGVVNEFNDSSTYDLPLANSVPADFFLVTLLPLESRSQNPTVAASGADNLKFDTGTDTDFQYDQQTWGPYTWISDGVSDWRLA